MVNTKTLLGALLVSAFSGVSASSGPTVSLLSCDKSRDTFKGKKHAEHQKWNPTLSYDGVLVDATPYAAVVAVSGATPLKQVGVLATASNDTATGETWNCAKNGGASIATAATAAEMAGIKVERADESGNAKLRFQVSSCEASYQAIDNLYRASACSASEVTSVGGLQGVMLTFPGSFAEDSVRDAELQAILEEHFDHGSAKDSAYEGFSFTVNDDGSLSITVAQSDFVQANRIFHDLRGLFEEHGHGNKHDNTVKRDAFNDAFYAALGTAPLGVEGGITSGAARSYISYVRG